MTLPPAAALRLAGESLVTSAAQSLAVAHAPSGVFVLGLGGLGGRGIGGTAGVVVIVVLMGLRMYMRSRGGGGGRGPWGRGPWR